MKRRIVLLGPPGSGKGTVARMIETGFGLEHISTGQWFRREMQDRTPLGEKVAGYVERGELVPDELVLGLIEHWLTPELIEHGFLFDGFPRTRGQAGALDAFCAEKQAPLDAVFYLSCPEDVILERISGRRVCANCGMTYHVQTLPPRANGVCDKCGAELVQRPDDAESVVRERLALYRRLTEPLVDYYQERGKLTVLNGVLGSEAAYKRAAEVLAS